MITTICAVDFGSTHFAYWAGRLRPTPDPDGCRVEVLAWRLVHPDQYVPNTKDSGWRQRAMRNIMLTEPALPQIQLFDPELQNPMDVHGKGQQGGERGAGNPVAYVSCAWLSYLSHKRKKTSYGMSTAFHAMIEQDPAFQHALVQPTHPRQKFTTFDIPLPQAGSHGQKRYRRKRTSCVLIRGILNRYPTCLGKTWLPVLQQHKDKQDDLCDVFWSGLSRLVRLHRARTSRLGSKKNPLAKRL